MEITKEQKEYIKEYLKSEVQDWIHDNPNEEGIIENKLTIMKSDEYNWISIGWGSFNRNDAEVETFTIDEKLDSLLSTIDKVIGIFIDRVKQLSGVNFYIEYDSEDCLISIISHDKPVLIISPDF